MTQPLVAVLDYGAGNLPSVQRGLERAGAQVLVTADARLAAAADALVVPGVGHFASCVAGLRQAGLSDFVAEWVRADRDLLGICVGMQLLYEHSEEGDTPGLGLLPGRVVRLRDHVRVPHTGWDVIVPTDGGHGDPLLEGVAGERAYFVHSFHPAPTDPAHVLAVCDYGGAFPCIVRAGRVVGTQFHPEKSGAVGARLLASWVGCLRAPVATPALAP